MRKILIAEDSKVISAALSEVMRDRYEVHTCNNGCVALEQLETLRPDALILNLTLSDIDGLAVLARTRYRPPVIVVLTNYISNGVITQASTLGAGYIFVIPCAIHSVVAQIDKMIELLPI